jgi:hypothetical protein
MSPILATGDTVKVLIHFFIFDDKWYWPPLTTLSFPVFVRHSFFKDVPTLPGLTEVDILK